LVADLDVLAANFREHNIHAGPPLACSRENVALFDKMLGLTSEVVQAKRLLALYWAGHCWADGQDREAAARYARLQQAVTALPGLLADLNAWVSRFACSELVEASSAAAEHQYWIERAHTAAEHELPAGEEELLAQLRSSGAAAWQRLRNDLISHLTAELDDLSVPFPALRKYSGNPDPERRRAAHYARQTALASIETPVSSCLNAIRGETLSLATRRGWTSPLAIALHANGIDEGVLELVHAAVEHLLPTMWKFAKAKAFLLGYEQLPAWDIAAPLPGERPLQWPQAIDLAVSAASVFSPDFADLVRKAADEQWIDAAERDGKRQTALCMPMRDGASRILINFDGSIDSILSLAHELGHAYHYRLLWDSPELQRIPPLGLAETASIFSESLLLQASAGRPPDERLALMNADLIGHFQVIVDTYSRYLFESELTRQRAKGPLSASLIGELLADAQKSAYGDSVDPSTLDHRMWITQPHYYDTLPFTNWPYYFGLLLSLGLFASGDVQDPDMRRRLQRLLARSGSADPVSLAKDCGADLRTPDFWFRAAAQLEGRVADFVAAADIQDLCDLRPGPRAADFTAAIALCQRQQQPPPDTTIRVSDRAPICEPFLTSRGRRPQ
jgi:oligoendopeptidase F